MTKNGFLKQFDFEVKSFGKSIDFFVLQLFSSYVDIPIEFLPEEAKDIHSECKGSPMVISMIGGLISESGRHSQRQRQSGRWGYYLNSLQSRKFSMSQFLNFRAKKSQKSWKFVYILENPLQFDEFILPKITKILI